MRVLSWNIRHGGGSRVPQIINTIISLKADICVLLEFRNNFHGLKIIDTLKKIGLKYCISPRVESKFNTVLIASRYNFDSSIEAENPLLKRFILHVKVSGINLIGVYFPQKNEKKAVFDFINDQSIKLLSEESLIVGDFNTGLHLIDETSSTFYCAENFEALYKLGWINKIDRDNKKKEYTWYSDAGNGFRIDHLLASPSLNNRIMKCSYLHEVRENKISDHSALFFEMN